MRVYLVPGVITVFSLVVIYASLQMDVSPPMIVGHSLQPRVFPILLMVVNLVLTAILVAQNRVHPPGEPPPVLWQTWGSMLLFVLFYPLTVYVDMLIAIAVVMLAMCLLWGERRTYVAGLVALLTPIIIFVIFDMALSVRFPRGLITNWYYG